MPGACPEGTVFDVTLQALIGEIEAGSVLCLKGAGLNADITGIAPGGGIFMTSDLIVSQAGQNGVCAVPGQVSVPAVLSSGVLPPSLTGRVVCVGFEVQGIVAMMRPKPK